MISPILAKDAKHLARNPLALAVMGVSIIAYVALFWLLPSERDQTFYFGIAHHGLGSMVEEARERNKDRDVELIEFQSEEELRTAIADRKEGSPELFAGVAFPSNFSTAVQARSQVAVSVYHDGASTEQANFLRAEIQELAFRAAGYPIPVRMSETEDMIVGHQARVEAPLNTLSRPALATVLLLFEILIIALLTSTEVRSGAISAILATPVRLNHLLMAKTIFGVTLAFSQVTLLCLLIGVFEQQVLLSLSTLFLGSVLVGGCGFFAGSRGRDLVGVAGWSLVFLLPMAIPAVASVLPGLSSDWIRLIPSWSLVEALTLITLEGASWRDVAILKLQLFVWALVFFFVGLGSFRRAVALR